jgi:hypothetical protein
VAQAGRLAAALEMVLVRSCAVVLRRYVPSGRTEDGVPPLLEKFQYLDLNLKFQYLDLSLHVFQNLFQYASQNLAPDAPVLSV